MKKLISLLFLLMALTVIVFAQTPDTVEEKTGFWKFWDQYAEAIIIALGAAGVIVWLRTRIKALRDALDVVLVAGDDTSPEGRKITQEEWNGIVLAFKLVWKPKVKDIKAEVQKINSENT